MKALAYLASTFGLACAIWLAMIFVGSATNGLLFYLAMLHPWVAPLIAVAIVGIVAWRVEGEA